MRLQVFKGAQHDHVAQKPVDITAQIDAKPKEGPGAAIHAALKAKAL